MKAKITELALRLALHRLREKGGLLAGKSGLAKMLPSSHSGIGKQSRP